MGIYSGSMVGQGKVRGRILVLGEGLVGLAHLHTHIVAMSKDGRDKSHDHSPRSGF